MSDVYVIEVGGNAVGIVARDEDGKSYRFHAAIPRAFGLDGRRFATPDDAHKAIRKALNAPPAEAGRSDLPVLGRAA